MSCNKRDLWCRSGVPMNSFPSPSLLLRILAEYIIIVVVLALFLLQYRLISMHILSAHQKTERPLKKIYW